MYNRIMKNSIIKIDLENGDEQTISERKFKKEIAKYYNDVDIAIDALKKGSTIRTTFYVYRLALTELR